MWNKKDAVHQLEHPEEVSKKISEQYEKLGEGIEKITSGEKEHGKKMD